MIMDALADAVFTLFLLCWGARQLRTGLFWLYLWQTKEYHAGRMRAHLADTRQGRRLIISFLPAAKLLLTGLIFLAVANAQALLLASVLAATVALYLAEGGRALVALARQQVLVPVWTLKMRVLALAAGGSMVVLLLFPLPAAPLLLDLALPLIVSLWVLASEAVAFAYRRIIMQRAAKKRSSNAHLRAVAITGSYGKTSTKEFLARMLETRFRVRKTRANRNSEMGIASCILEEMDTRDEVFVAEMGAYGKGGIAMLMPMVLPSAGIVTGVNAQHLAVFGSRDRLLSAEGGGELASLLPREAPLIVNADSEDAARLADQRAGSIRCSARRKADVWAEVLEVEKTRLAVRLCGPEGCTEQFEVPVAGRQYAENIAVAAAAAREFGVPLEDSARALEGMPAVEEFSAVRSGIRGISVLDSSYSANPDGAVADIEHLRMWNGRRAIVLAPLIELGSSAREVHRRIGSAIARTCEVALVWGDDWIEDLREGAADGCDIRRVRGAEDVRSGIEAFSGSEDIVLLEGRLPSHIINAVMPVES